MTINEQVALATDKGGHWNSKREHALAMLTKWQARLTALQSNGKSQPGDQADECLARDAALHDIAEETGDKVVPIKGKAAGKSKPPKKH
jgi:hypothetical protein